MSEEEKEAIEYLKNRLDILHNNTQWATEKSIKVVLNLIDKLKDNLHEEQEQNEYLKDKVDKQQKRIEKLTTTLFHYEDTLEHYEYKVFNGNIIDLEKVKESDKIRILGKEYISKDKIKKFIKDELPDDEEMKYCMIVDVNGIELRKKLEELLEEN